MKKQLKWIIAALAVTAVATPALAEDGIKFYGSVRLKTNYTIESDGATAYTTDQRTDDSVLTLQNNSRFGANVTTGAIGGKVEMGFKNPESDKNAMYTRLLYGTWKTEGGNTLLVGQNYNPYWSSYAIVARDDDGMTGFGNLYEQRTPQIRLDLASGLYMALIENQATKGGTALYAPFNSPAVTLAYTNDTTKALLPKLCLGFKKTAGAMTVNTGVAYQQFDLFNATQTTKDTIVSYLGYFEAVVKASETVTAQAKVHYGQNLAEFGLSLLDKTYNTASHENTQAYGGVAQLNVGQAAVGFSYTVEEQDATKSNKDVLAFVNYSIVPVKGFTVVPEIAYLDKNVNAFDWDGADEVVASIKWQMDF